MKYVCFFLLVITESIDILDHRIGRREANGFLHRMRRAQNSFGLEESWEGNMEGECIEEDCTKEELHEALDMYDEPTQNKYKDIYHTCTKVVEIIQETDKDIHNFDAKDLLRQCIHSQVAQYFSYYG